MHGGYLLAHTHTFLQWLPLQCTLVKGFLRCYDCITWNCSLPVPPCKDSKRA